MTTRTANHREVSARGSTHNGKRTSSVPKPLATPTDLAPADVQAVAAAINPLVADAIALYVKTKNFHWHVSGPRFRDLHLMFDEQAEQVLDSVDLLAERVRRIGGTTLRSIGQVATITSIKDDDEDFVPAQEMIGRLLEDNCTAAQSQRRAIDVCEEHGDSVTANVLEEILDQTEKRIWFLHETLQSDQE